MAEETKVGIKMEEETKPLKKLCEKLEETITHEFNKGIERIKVEEMGKAIDMLKDLYEAKKYMLEGCYFKSVVEAMEEYGEDEAMEDDERRGYRGQPRSESGRFMSRGDGRRSNRGRGRRGYESPMMMYDDMDDWYEMERMRDMDRGAGKMYYSGSGSAGGMSGGQSSGGMSGGSRGYSDGVNQGGSRGNQSSSRSENARRNYTETKQMGKSSGMENKQENMKNLEEYMKELSTEMTDLISDMDSSEKQLLKQKMSTLMQKIQ